MSHPCDGCNHLTSQRGVAWCRMKNLQAKRKCPSYSIPIPDENPADAAKARIAEVLKRVQPGFQALVDPHLPINLGEPIKSVDALEAAVPGATQLAQQFRSVFGDGVRLRGFTHEDEEYRD